jgi:hypothetical protein
MPPSSQTLGCEGHGKTHAVTPSWSLCLGTQGRDQSPWLLVGLGALKALSIIPRNT